MEFCILSMYFFFNDKGTTEIYTYCLSLHDALPICVAHVTASGTAKEFCMPVDQDTVGVDFGTLSGRAVVVRVSDGAEIASAVHDYRHAVLEETLPGGDRKSTRLNSSH